MELVGRTRHVHTRDPKDKSTPRDDAVKKVNRILGRRGLGTLDDPGTIHQLAYLARDHEFFRKFLQILEPILRRELYEAMVPHLRFKPRTLDEYLAEAAADAEARQLPTVGEDGMLQPYKGVEVLSTAEHSLAKANQQVIDIAQATLESMEAKEHLLLVCRKCTREQVFKGPTKADVIGKARDEGWTYDEMNGKGGEVCPTCP